MRDRNPQGDDNWLLVKQFSSLLVHEISGPPVRTVPNDINVAVIVFSDMAKQVFALNDYNATVDIMLAIEEIPFEGGNANIADGFNQARIQCFNPANGDRPDARNVAVLISPGIVSSPSEREMALAAARELKDTGVTLLTVGVTDVVDQNFLSTAASALQQGELSLPSSTIRIPERFLQQHNTRRALGRLVLNCNTGKLNLQFLDCV